MDIGGPVGTLTYDQESYHILFKVEYSNYRFAYTLKNRSEAFEKIKQVVTFIRVDTKKEVRYFYSDRGGEFTSNLTNDFFQ